MLFSIFQLSTFLLGNIFSSPGRDRMSRHDLSGSIIINSSCRSRHGVAEDENVFLVVVEDTCFSSRKVAL